MLVVVVVVSVVDVVALGLNVYMVSGVVSVQGFAIQPSFSG